MGGWLPWLGGCRATLRAKKKSYRAVSVCDALILAHWVDCSSGAPALLPGRQVVSWGEMNKRALFGSCSPLAVVSRPVVLLGRPK